MRLTRPLLLAAALCALTPLPLLAEEPPAAGVSDAPAIAPAIATEAAEPHQPKPGAEAMPEPVSGSATAALAGMVVELIGSAKDAEALNSFYGAPDAAMLWVSQTRPLRGAREAAAELARAGDYGLDAQTYHVPDLSAEAMEMKALARIELQMSRVVLAYVREAWGGRVANAKIGTQLPIPPSLPEPLDILNWLKAASDKSAFMRDQHPNHPQFDALREELRALRQADQKSDTVQIPDGPVLRRGDAHAQIPLLRARLGQSEDAGESFDAALETALKAYQSENGLSADGVLGSGTRTALNADTSEKWHYQVLLNMERWRWLPRPMDGGTGIYVWSNIPEFRVRVMQGGKSVFEEKAIVGTVDKQTPVFSDLMEWIEIHPTWYVPNSIKVDDILPSLRRNTSRIMSRYHLRMDCGALGRDPTRVDWNSVDIRKCAFSQPPGEKSVLGDFKFKFPNSHDVYMHDTLTRRLFETSTRTYSHGCVRVKNPQRMAEILLGHDDIMSAESLSKVLAGPKKLRKEILKRPIPVHLTYFTASIDENGARASAPDYYGHDRRLAATLYGKGALFPAAKMPRRRKPTTRRPPPQPKKEWWEEAMQN